jgi:hypothetical protein
MGGLQLVSGCDGCLSAYVLVPCTLCALAKSALDTRKGKYGTRLKTGQHSMTAVTGREGKQKRSARKLVTR